MLKHKGTLEIETDRLILRRFLKSDAKDKFKNWANDAKVTQYLTWSDHKDINVTESILTNWIESYKNDDFYQWAIMLKAINQVVGSISVVGSSETNEHCEIGYCIGREFWGKGITTEALKAIIIYLFDEVGFNRIEAIHHSENVASGRVIQKAGMQYEGRKRSFHKNLNGIFVDCESYAILRQDNRNY